jgi:hypothetical protein
MMNLNETPAIFSRPDVAIQFFYILKFNFFELRFYAVPVVYITAG